MKNPNSGHIMSEETMAKALMEFQSFAGLNLTGKRVIVPPDSSEPSLKNSRKMSVNPKRRCIYIAKLYIYTSWRV